MPSSPSSVWFGWSREDRVPRRPIVVLQVVWTRILFAAYTRSRFDMSFATAATVSEVRPFRSHSMSACCVFSERRKARSSAMDQLRMRA